MIGLAQYSSSNIVFLMEKTKNANLMLKKRGELALLNKYEYSTIQLMLTAMDSIIDKDEGTGLGLAVVHGIVESYRGKGLHLS